MWKDKQFVVVAPTSTEVQNGNWQLFYSKRPATLSQRYCKSARTRAHAFSMYDGRSAFAIAGLTDCMEQSSGSCLKSEHHWSCFQMHVNVSVCTVVAHWVHRVPTHRCTIKTDTRMQNSYKPKIARRFLCEWTGTIRNSFRNGDDLKANTEWPANNTKSLMYIIIANTKKVLKNIPTVC